MLHLQTIVMFDIIFNAFLSSFSFQESKINVGERSIFIVVQKAEDGWWKRLLRGEGKPPHYVKVDWDKWVDEDEDDGNNGMHDFYYNKLMCYRMQCNFMHSLIKLAHCWLIR